MGELPACVLFIFFPFHNCDELALCCVSVLHQVLHHLSLSSIKFVGTAAGSCGIFGVQLLLPVGEEDCVTISC
jgi:hypothetical protein